MIFEVQLPEQNTKKTVENVRNMSISCLQYVREQHVSNKWATREQHVNNMYCSCEQQLKFGKYFFRYSGTK